MGLLLKQVVIEPAVDHTAVATVAPDLHTGVTCVAHPGTWPWCTDGGEGRCSQAPGAILTGEGCRAGGGHPLREAALRTPGRRPRAGHPTAGGYISHSVPMAVRNTGPGRAQGHRGSKQWFQIRPNSTESARLFKFNTIPISPMLTFFFSFSGKIFSWCLYEFHKPALTKYHKLGGLKQ